MALSVSSRPPPQLVKAAKAAAASPHGLINLIRLVGSLDASSAELLDDDRDDAASKLQQRKQLKRDLETASYARVLLDTLRDGNEQASTTASTLQSLDKTLSGVEGRYTTALSNALPASAPLSKSVSRQSAASIERPRSAIPSAASRVQTPVETTTTPPRPAPPRQPSVRRRNVPPLATYLATRAAEDEKGNEVGLLPVRTRPTVPAEKSDRDQLLAGGIGMGAAQLHEELGGQLADMSHRLKLNAVHFSNSLEAEKALLESSQQTLEGNLTATKSSKKHLSSVSSKGRSTTCMTLGIVILVLIIFVWTYMLIRFT